VTAASAFPEARQIVDSAVPEGRWVTPDNLEPLRGVRGSYVLLVQLEQALNIGAGRQKTGHLPSGTFLYAGSAHGSGGLGARLGRHFRAGKKVHWHIDRLTVEASGLAAVAVENGNECQLVQALMLSDRVRVALDGFGSTDCRTCRSHLLMVR
jgi:Uri superfamily endonuclease